MVTVFYKLISKTIVTKFITPSENDSLLFLYILASNTLTIVFLQLLTTWLFFSKKQLDSSKNIIACAVLCYFLYVNDYNMYVNIFFKISGINSTLQNGLLNIHPIIIYYLYALVICLWFWNSIIKSLKNYRHITTTTLYYVNILVLLGIYLGAFWANQELNWGGFWSWDPVEIVSLVIALFFIKQVHNLSNIYLNKFVWIYIITVWVVYIIIRLGVVNTIHSFIRSNNTPLYVFVSICIIYIYYIVFCINSGPQWTKILKYSYFVKPYKIQTSIVFVYTYVYILGILVANNVQFYTPNPSDVFIFFTIFTYIYFSFVVTQINQTLPYIIMIFLFSILFGIKFFFIIFCVFTVNKFFKKYNTQHLILLLIYLLYYVYMNQLVIFNKINEFYIYTYNLNNLSCLTSSCQNYETNFFIKKQSILVKLKSLVHHVTSFNIQSNIFLSIYIFSKNYSLKFLFLLEMVFISFFIFSVLFVFFLKLMVYNNTKQTRKY